MRVSAVGVWFSFHRLYADFVLSSFDDAAEIRKRTKYTNIAESHIFQPIAFETTGAAGPSTRVFLKQLCSYLIRETGDNREASWLKQRLAIAIARGNAASARGGVPS